jgi:hypothetical protein
MKKGTIKKMSNPPAAGAIKSQARMVSACRRRRKYRGLGAGEGVTMLVVDSPPGAR